MVKAYRYPQNPIIKPSDVKAWQNGYEVICAFNAAAIEHNDETLLLLRVAERPIATSSEEILVPVFDANLPPPGLKCLTFTPQDDGICLDDSRVITFPGKVFLTSISHLRLARSKDGINFTVDESPALVPDQEYEEFGIEDPRITKFGEIYYIVYKGVASTGITQCLASTKDFISWEKHGIVLCPENMDALIFPEKIRGKYALMHRPQPKFIGSPNMWVAYSDDLIHWGEHKFMLGCNDGTWEGGRIGGGAVPFLTDEGWVEIYHAATADDRYCLGALLLDKDYPEKVIAKSMEPILQPEAPYEVYGFKHNVIFTCGAIVKGDKVTIYYGAGDECMAAADLSLTEIMASLQKV